MAKFKFPNCIVSITHLPPFKPYLSVPKRSLQLFQLSSLAGFERLGFQLQAKHSDSSTVYAIVGVFIVMH